MLLLLLLRFLSLKAVPSLHSLVVFLLLVVSITDVRFVVFTLSFVWTLLLL